VIHREYIIHTAPPLRRIFWGALLVLLDVTYTWTSNGEGFRVDFLSDTVGLVLIIAAVTRLGDIRMGSSYVSRMRFIRWVSILLLLESLMQHFIFDTPWLLTFLSSVLGIATIVAVLWFCACMRDVCREAMLAEAARIWHRTLVLFLVVYGIPWGLLLIAALIAMVTGRPFHFDLGPAGGLLFVAVFVVPLLSFFSATATMARSAEEMPAATPEAATLPRATALHGH
jgi:hypothetical protein